MEPKLLKCLGTGRRRVPARLRCFKVKWSLALTAIWVTVVKVKQSSVGEMLMTSGITISNNAMLSITGPKRGEWPQLARARALSGGRALRSTPQGCTGGVAGFYNRRQGMCQVHPHLLDRSHVICNVVHKCFAAYARRRARRIHRTP